jgi:hypothetical protein
MPSTASKKTLWTGRALSAIPVLLILFAAVPKLLMAAPVVEGFKQAGFPEYLVPVVGIIELACALVYLVPPTRILGAILITGLLGGATATNLRIGDATWIVPALLGVLAWAGLFLRDDRLRALIPLRS